jgi:hypothetical protein
VSEIRCRWGHWSLIEASLEAFRRAAELHDPEWIVLISGQDYPIRSLEAWEATLLTGEDDAVLESDALVQGPPGIRPGSNAERLRMRYTHRWYWLPRLNVIPRLPRPVTQSVRRVWFRCFYPLQAVMVLHQLPRREGWVLGIRRSDVPWSKDMPVYKGSQWIALSRRAYAECIDGRTAGGLRDYFARTLVPDEAYFHTLLASTPGMRIRHEPVTWVTWDSDVDPHPHVIDQPSLAMALDSGAPFARKFDESAHPGILDRLDRTLLAGALS